MTRVLSPSGRLTVLWAVAALVLFGSSCDQGAGELASPSSPLFAVTVTSIQVSPGTVTLAPNQQQTFTATAKLSDGSTITPTVVWSATGGTITSVGLYQAGSTTGTYRVIARRKEGTEADTAVVTISSTGSTQATLLVYEDFSTYSSTSDLIANPRGVFKSNEDWNPQKIVLDRSVGYGGSSRSMRYDFPASGCGSKTISRGVKPIPSHTRELWLEVVARFAGNFSTLMPSSYNCSYAPQYKFLFGVLPGGGGRFDVYAGTFGWRWDGAYPGKPGAYTGLKSPFGNGFDGKWHTYRVHWKLSSSPTTSDGVYEMWMDGVKVVNGLGIRTDSKGYPNEFYVIRLGANINNGPAQAQSVWWGMVRLYSGNPGW